MGTTMTATMVYLKDSQKKRLKQLAKTKKTSLAEELRNAVEQYLNSGQIDINEEELNTLVAEASTSVKQMIAEIDSTLQYAKEVFSKIEEREHGRERHN
ncbi:MAG: hypothetical protein IBX72_14465 [Nitrospirae bacterium]|nr:hypothetical protein [Nitrospirota bacterium]